MKPVESASFDSLRMSDMREVPGMARSDTIPS